MTREEAEEACEGEPGVLFCDGYDNCILGVVHHPVCKVVYDGDAMLQAMVDDWAEDIEEAMEHMAYNIEGSYVGEHTPLYVYGVS